MMTDNTVDLEVVNSDIKSINLGNLKTVEFDLDLPLSGKLGSDIVWETSDERWLTSQGVVTRPTYGRGNRIVTLTATVQKGTASNQREFKVNVLQEGNHIKVKQVYPIELTVKMNTDFYLPSAVAIQTDDNRVISHLVEWDGPTKRSYQAVGTYEVTGCIKDTAYQFTATIVVSSEVKAALDLPQKLSLFALDHVRLSEGTPFYEAQQNRLAFLLNVNDDQMLHNFRTAAGLDTRDAPEMIGWDAPNSLLKGHTTGHYLSALAKCFATTGNSKILSKLDYMVQELMAVQAAFSKKAGIHEGFLSGYSQEQFDLLEVYKPYPEIWAPYYTLHKILAGLIDAYEYGHNQNALEIAKKIGHWTYQRLSRLPHDQLVKMWSMYIAGEFGGMNDSLARLTKITGDQEFVECAKLFDNDKLMFPLLENVDALNGMHANQHIPQVIGWLEIFSVTHEEKYYIAAKRFWDFVVNNHVYSIGGVGNGEMFHAPNDIAGQLGKDTAETCATYNMLKLTELLMQYQPDTKYMAYYEHATYNHILATTADNQNGESTYFMPTSTGHHREFDDENSCCHGTGLENHFMYNTGIYFKDDQSFYINLLMDSTLIDQQHHVTIKTREAVNEVAVQIITELLAEKTLKVRIPEWGTIGSVVVNNQEVTTGQKGQYIELPLTATDNTIQIIFNKEALVIPSDKTTVFSIQRGPYVLVQSGADLAEIKLTNDLEQLNLITQQSERFMPLYSVGNNDYQLYFETASELEE